MTDTTYLDTARRLIPSGTQTYSKSPSRFPKGAPETIVSASGAYVFDESGRPWLDCVSGLGSVILGHRDPEVLHAIGRQAYAGVAFPLPSRLELELAERIRQLVPSAEMVRFAKNGADACAAAVRIARAATGHDRVVSIGYHGYHDYTIAQQNPRGVPWGAKDDLTIVPYGDVEAIRAALNPDGNPAACLIMEPIVAQHPEHPPAGYLEGVRKLCDETGTLLVFDEVVTFGRMLTGTAQRYFGVTPDLTALGKCLANGLPLSAVVGRADLMKLLEEGVFFSTTFGGEALSLAAGIATLDKLVREDVPQAVNETGARIAAAFRDASDREGIADRVQLLGYPSRLVWKWEDPDDARLFGEALIRSSVLSQGYISFTLAFAETELMRLEQAIRGAMQAVAHHAAVQAA